MSWKDISLGDLATRAKDAAKAAADQIKQVAIDAADRANDTKNAVVEGTKNAVDAALGHKEKK
jgi:ElaB/YqjD/DUF883 family membrane-anchored ribosome-binding protein